MADNPTFSSPPDPGAQVDSDQAITSSTEDFSVGQLTRALDQLNVKSVMLFKDPKDKVWIFSGFLTSV